MVQFHNKLREMLKGCHMKGDFVLSRGARADDYYDLAPLFLSPLGLRVAVMEVEAYLRSMRYDAVGCLELCPVPLVGAVLGQKFNGTRGFVVRKVRKDYGTDRLVEGNLRVGDKVVILEDVTSTGRSVMHAIRAVEGFGCGVVCVLTVINRCEGCNDLLADYNFKWLFTKEELDG